MTVTATGGGGGAVTSIVAGAGVGIAPASGIGDVTITATGGGGTATVFDTSEFDGAGTAADPTGLVTPYTAPEKTKLAGIAAGAEVNPSTVNATAARAGTSSTAYLWTPQRVRQAIDALAPVTSIVAGAGVSIAPASGIGDVTITATGGGGTATVFDTSEFDGAGTAADPTGLVTPFTSPEKTKLAGIAVRRRRQSSSRYPHRS